MGPYRPVSHLPGPRRSSIADVIVELEVGRMASEFENRMIIKKIRNHPEKAAVLIYAVTEHGITPEMITRVA